MGSVSDRFSQKFVIFSCRTVSRNRPNLVVFSLFSTIFGIGVANLGACSTRFLLGSNRKSFVLRPDLGFQFSHRFRCLDRDISIFLRSRSRQRFYFAFRSWALGVAFSAVVRVFSKGGTKVSPTKSLALFPRGQGVIFGSSVSGSSWW